MVGFIFGGEGMPKTPQELEQMRMMARSMMRGSRTPQNVGEGIASIGDAIAMRMMMSKANKAETDGIAKAESAFSSLFDTPDVTPSDTAAVPPVDTSSDVVQPTISSPQDAVDAAPMKPLTGDLAATEAYIRQAAQKRGIDPDKAVRVARSEGLAPGVWQSRIKKNGMFEPSYGPFQMLVGDGENFPLGMGNDFQEDTGLDPRDPKNVNAMIDFALDTAKKDGWRQWYGAKKVGINRWDGINANEVASVDPTVPANAMLPQQQEAVPVVPVPEGFQQPDPLATAQKPSVKVAQALGKFDTMKAMEVMNDPFLPPARKAVLGALIKQQLENDNMEREQQLKQADPKYQVDLEKSRLEVDKIKNPPKTRRMTDEEEKEAGFDTSGVYEIKPDGSTTVVIQPKEGLKPTSDMQEYEAYKADVLAAGGKPLGRLEYLQALRSSSANRTEVNIDNKAEGAFEKKLAEGQAEAFNKMAEEGMNARADLDVVNQLDTLMKGQGGMLSGISAAIAKMGIPVEGADDLQATSALINKLVPTQRQPGSGTMSDRDVQLFKDSLPSLWNQPGGNEKILGVMRGMAEYKQAQGEIADMVLTGEMTRQEARRALRNLPNPLEEFRKAQAEKKADAPAKTAADPDFSTMTDEQLEEFIKNGGR